MWTWRGAMWVLTACLLVAASGSASAGSTAWIPLVGTGLAVAPTPKVTAPPTSDPDRTPLPVCSAPGDYVCPCWPDLDCADFASQYEAQLCYEHCLSQTGGDSHGLDHDKDGYACENSPRTCVTATPTLTPAPSPSPRPAEF